VFGELKQLDAPEWLAVMDKLAATPFKGKDRSVAGLGGDHCHADGGVRRSHVPHARQ
jgi:hypothetical protein